MLGGGQRWRACVGETVMEKVGGISEWGDVVWKTSRKQGKGKEREEGEERGMRYGRIKCNWEGEGWIKRRKGKERSEL